MKRAIALCCIAALVLALGACAPAPAAGEDTLRVYASFYVLYDFAGKIGGDKAQIINMVPPGTEAHDWEPTATDIAALEEADILLYNGAGLEHWVEGVLAALQNQHLITVETSRDIPLLPSGAHHAHGDDHEQDDHAQDHAHDTHTHDPHVWLNPQNAKLQMQHIKDAFVQADPANSAYYQANYDTYAAQLDALDDEFHTTLDPLPNKDIIVAHQAFGYLCAAYGLTQVPVEGLSPDSEPDPARMAEVIDYAQAHDIRVIFFETLVSPKVAQTIADAVGATTAILSPLESLSAQQVQAGDDYFSIMRQNLQALHAALQ